MLLLNSYDTISSLVSLHVPCSRKLFLVYCRHVLLSSLKRLGFVYWHEVVHIRHACISLHPWTTMHMSKSRSLEENLPPPSKKKNYRRFALNYFQQEHRFFRVPQRQFLVNSIYTRTSR